MVFWMHEFKDLSQMVWKHATNLFKKTHSAESVMFWYVLLGKVGLLAQLYEKDTGENPLDKKGHSIGKNGKPFQPFPNYYFPCWMICSFIKKI